MRMDIISVLPGKKKQGNTLPAEIDVYQVGEKIKLDGCPRGLGFNTGLTLTF